MALFGSKKNKQEKKETTATAPASGNISGVRGSVAHVLKNPRITEKASMQQGMSVYTFDVATSATKRQIAQAVREVYKVSPRKIAVVTVPRKETRSARSGKIGMTKIGKKAYVYLRSGETITIA